MKYIIKLTLFFSFFISLITNCLGQDLDTLRNALEDINLLTVNQQVKYNVHSLDPVTNQPMYRMDALHVMELKKQANINTYGRYVGVYHHKSGGPLDFEIHLATSEDLMNWTFRKVLLTHADMPYIIRSTSDVTSEANSWIVLAHEEWQTNGSCKLAFKTYYDEDVLLSGLHSFGYTADITLSDKGLEGTPSIYSAELLLRNDRWVVDLNVGFHYNKQVSNEAGARDMVGTAILTDFGNNNSWATQAATNYMDHITLQGATGNVGQRDFITINDNKFALQEGNIQGAPYDKWDFGAWRLWIYQYKDETGMVPAPSDVVNINFWDTYFKPFFPRTHNRSTSFGNPSIKILTNPNDTTSQVLFAHFYIFGEGAATGEAGPCIFYQPISSQASVSTSSESISIQTLNNPEKSLNVEVYKSDINQINYRIKTEKSSDCKVQVFDINQKILYQGIVKPSEINTNKVLYLNKLALGIYFFSVVQGRERTVKKIVL